MTSPTIERLARVFEGAYHGYPDEEVEMPSPAAMEAVLAILTALKDVDETALILSCHAYVLRNEQTPSRSEAIKAAWQAILDHLINEARKQKDTP